MFSPNIPIIVATWDITIVSKRISGILLEKNAFHHMKQILRYQGKLGHIQTGL